MLRFFCCSTAHGELTEREEAALWKAKELALSSSTVKCQEVATQRPDTSLKALETIVAAPSGPKSPRLVQLIKETVSLFGRVSNNFTKSYCNQDSSRRRPKAGIGASVERTDKGWQIKEVEKGTSSHGNLQPGDTLLAIDVADCTGTSMATIDDIVDQLEGEEGTFVKILVQRRKGQIRSWWMGSEVLEFSLCRNGKLSTCPEEKPFPQELRKRKATYNFHNLDWSDLDRECRRALFREAQARVEPWQLKNIAHSVSASRRSLAETVATAAPCEPGTAVPKVDEE